MIAAAMTTASVTTANMTAALLPAEFRAAGTDLSERRRSGVSRGPLIDLTASPDTSGIAWGADGAARIGALTTIAAIGAEAASPRPIRASRRPRGTSPRRRSGTSQRSAAISPSVRAAGTTAIRTSPA